MKQRSRSRMATRRAARQRRRNLVLAGGVSLVILIVFLGYYLVLRSQINKVPKNIICDNIFIGDVDVSGMNAKQAKAALEKKVSEYQEKKVTLVAEEVEEDVHLSELGFRIKKIDKHVKEAVSYGKEGSVWGRSSEMKALKKNAKVIKVVYGVDSKLVQKVIDKKIPELKNAAKNATIKRANGSFVITDEVKGVMIDSKESVKVIETYLNSKWNKKSAQIQLVTKVEEPKVTKEQLKNIKDLLGTYTTVCGTGGGRVQNIQTGAKHINGAILMPGEEYSANAAMEPYTHENGFAEAGSYENGKVVQSMGGGICQVSTTLYNAVIRAELEIVERAAHSMLVGYVEPSMDAAIAGTFKDLKFKNNTETPIYIEGYVSGGKITFNVFGKETRPATRKVEFETEIVSQTDAGKKFEATADAVGVLKKASSGYTGTKAKLWKVVYENGVEVSRTVFNNSSYRASAAIYHVGTASDNAEAVALVTNAIASQDEAAINAAVAQAKTMVETPPETTESTTPPAETPPVDAP